MADVTRLHFGGGDSVVVIGTPEEIAAQLTGARREGGGGFLKFELTFDRKPVYVAVHQVIYFEAET